MAKKRANKQRVTFRTGQVDPAGVDLPKPKPKPRREKTWQQIEAEADRKRSGQ